MTLTPKENSLLKDLRSQEQLCVEKYSKYSNDACDAQLKNLLNQIGQTESQHLKTLDQISSGAIPTMSAGGPKPDASSIRPSTCDAQGKSRDAFLCSDLLATEKHVSSEYNTCIFEFSNPQLRNVLNHIQKEEQEHGEQLYVYMSKNGMYS